MKFLAGPVGQKIYSVDTQHLPTWMDLLDDPEAAYDRVQPQMDVYCPFAVPNYAETE